MVHDVVVAFAVDVAVAVVVAAAVVAVAVAVVVIVSQHVKSKTNLSTCTFGKIHSPVSTTTTSIASPFSGWSMSASTGQNAARLL